MNFEEFNIFGKKINIRKLIKELAKIGLILLILFSIFLLNHSVLLSPDDYNYTFVQGTYQSKRVDSIANCVETGKYFYQNWTGRVIPHVLIGIFRNINPIIYEIVNTIVFMIFIIMITKILNRKSGFLSILAVFGYFAFSMMFGEKFAWISGSFNYLWPSTLLVIFIYYVYKFFIGEKKFNLLSKIALILYSLITGFMHENTAFVGGAFLVCLVFFNLKVFIILEKNKKITIALIITFLALGAFANIFAPGNFTRMNQETGIGFSLDFLDNYKLNSGPLLIVFLSMLFVFILENIEIIKKEKLNFFKLETLKKCEYKNLKLEVLNFILPALIATIPMAIVGYFPPRAFLAYEIMFAIVLSKNIVIISEYFKEKDILIAITSIVLTLIVFAKYSPSTLAQINYIVPYKKSITQQYESAASSGEKDVLVSKFKYAQWIHVEDYINIHNFFPDFNYKMPTNVIISRYYGFDRLTAIGEDEYLIEIKVDTEGINKYKIIDRQTGEEIDKIEYDNEIRILIPKEKLGIYVLDCRENKVHTKILSYKVRCIGEEITENVKLEDLLLTE